MTEQDTINAFAQWDIELPNGEGYINLLDFYNALREGTIKYDEEGDGSANRGYFIQEIGRWLPVKPAPFMGMNAKDIQLQLTPYLIPALDVGQEPKDPDTIDSEVIDDEEGTTPTDKSLNYYQLAIIGALVYLVFIKK